MNHQEWTDRQDHTTAELDGYEVEIFHHLE